MVDAHRFRLEHQQREDGEHGQGDCLLDDFELPKVKRSAVIDETNPVSGYHETVLDASQQPT